jgi:predicted secreted Zn-dependent protease
MMLRALCSGLIFLVSQNSTAEVKASLDYLYYTANANSGGSMTAILARSAPIYPDGTDYFGRTNWHVTWHYRWHFNADDACRITESTTELTAAITLPRLVNGTTTQVDLMNGYLAALRVHELGHFNIGREAADDIDRAILALPQMANCQALGSEANRVAEEILDKWRAAEKHYDAETAHGKSQGAVLRD